MTERLTGALARVSASVLALGVGVPAAVINKQLAERGHRTFGTPADLASSLFSGSSHVATAMQVVTAFVLLCVAVAAIAGVWRMLRGDRGGVELAASGIFGLLGLIAAVTVIM